MIDHDRYIAEIDIQGLKFKIFIAVHKSIPDDHVDDFIQKEVFDYLKSIVRYTYSLKII